MQSSHCLGEFVTMQNVDYEKNETFLFVKGHALSLPKVDTHTPHTLFSKQSWGVPSGKPRQTTFFSMKTSDLLSFYQMMMDLSLVMSTSLMRVSRMEKHGRWKRRTHQVLATARPTPRSARHATPLPMTAPPVTRRITRVSTKNT